MDKVNDNNKKITQTWSKIAGGFHLISLADLFPVHPCRKKHTQTFSIKVNRKISATSSVM